MWRQFYMSGFFFRIEGGRSVQGAVITCNENNELGWSICMGSSAQRYWDTRPDLFTTPAPEYQLDLDQIPRFMTNNDDFSFALSIIAED